MRNAAVLAGSDVSKTHLDRAVRQSVRLQSNHYIPNNAKSLLQALQGLMDHAGLITEQHAFPVYSSLGTYPIPQQTCQGIYYILMKL
jgi:hypothetical protein